MLLQSFCEFDTPAGYKTSFDAHAVVAFAPDLLLKDTVTVVSLHGIAKPVLVEVPYDDFQRQLEAQIDAQDRGEIDDSWRLN